MFPGKQTFCLLVASWAVTAAAPAQVLHNEKRDQHAQQALKLSQEITSGETFDKLLKNLAEAARLDEKATVETAQFNLGPILDGLKTWRSVTRLVGSIEQDLALGQPAAPGDLKKEITALHQEMAGARQAAADLKKKLAADPAKDRLGAIGLWLERIGRAEPVYGYLDRFLRQDDADEDSRPARLETAKEMQSLLQQLSKLYQDFGVSLPKSPSLLWLQTRLELLRLEEQSLERRVQIRERRDSETRPILSLLKQTKAGLKLLHPADLDKHIADSLKEQAKRAAGDASERDRLEAMIFALYNAAALAARGATPVHLALLRESSEERALSIRQMAARARLYESLVGTGVERLALFHQRGIRSASLAQIVQALATLGLIPAILTR